MKRYDIHLSKKDRQEGNKYRRKRVLFISQGGILKTEQNYTTKGEVCYHPAQEKTGWRSRHRGFESNPDGA